MRHLYLVAIVAATAVAITLTNGQRADIPIECPKEDGKDVVHIADPNDCHRFYKCDQGVAVSMPCPLSNDGRIRLCFNAELQVCDWPWNVTCCNGDESSTTSSTTTSAPPTPPTTQPTTTSSSTPGGSEKCPPTGSVKIPDETDCRYYYECERGQKSGPYKCRDGHYFNPIVQQCDRPKNVPNCPKISILSA